VIFSVDTNVILDVLLADPIYGPSSKKTLEAALARGRLIICPLVYAELAPLFDTPEDLDRTLATMGIKLKPFTREVLHTAGIWWKEFLKRGGKRKNRILADFLIAAFAGQTSQALITRDAFFEKYVTVVYSRET